MSAPTLQERLAQAEAVLTQAGDALHALGVRRAQLAVEEQLLTAQRARAEGAVAVLRELAAEAKRDRPAAGSQDPAPAPGAVPSPG